MIDRMDRRHVPWLPPIRQPEEPVEVTFIYRDEVSEPRTYERGMFVNELKIEATIWLLYQREPVTIADTQLTCAGRASSSQATFLGH